MHAPAISRYRILHKIGTGGRGAVYEAEDLRPGRHAALKFLPESRTTPMRFEREARAASLDHPHCTISDNSRLYVQHLSTQICYLQLQLH
jgi:serine/threonine protein kinase